LAYKAYKNWQHGNYDTSSVTESSFSTPEILSPEYQLTLIKAMIAAARVDGHIDAVEQQRIFGALDEMELTTDQKAMMFDLMRQPITIDELVMGATSLEQKSELYLVSCLFLDSDQAEESVHLQQLAYAMRLPDGLCQQLPLCILVLKQLLQPGD
ncbi:MAG: tellurite resistance TerB family protein, partial [Gammaproteobacteria bacterium]